MLPPTPPPIVTIPATVSQRSEIPEGLTNYPVHVMKLFIMQFSLTSFRYSSLYLNTVLNTVFSNTQQLYPSRRVREKVSRFLKEQVKFLFVFRQQMERRKFLR
jgi:hypothetical protein